jgi:hypothetical protein
MLLEMKNGKPYALSNSNIKREGVEYADRNTTIAYAKEKNMLSNAVFMDNPDTGKMELVAFDVDNLTEEEKATIEKYKK